MRRALLSNLESAILNALARAREHTPRRRPPGVVSRQPGLPDPHQRDPPPLHERAGTLTQEFAKVTVKIDGDKEDSVGREQPSHLGHAASVANGFRLFNCFGTEAHGTRAVPWLPA